MDKSIFQNSDYKVFVRAWIEAQPKKGRGQLLKIGQLLNVSSVSVSHIFSGPRHLTSDQALEVAEFMGLAEKETEMFLLLVERDRASTVKLKNRIQRDIEVKRRLAQDLKSRLPQDAHLDEAARAIFYSQWYYSGVRILTSIDEFQSVNSIAERLSLPNNQVREVLDFLVRFGLCVESDGLFKIGPRKTHLGNDSNLVTRHHSNWRQKALENMRGKNSEPEELFYTGPMTLSQEGLAMVRKVLVETIDQVLKIVAPSPSEEFACLNIDWFKVRK